MHLIEQDQVVIPTAPMIKGSRPFYWIMLKEANLSGMCLDDVYLGFGSRVASYWGRTAHSVNHVFSLHYVYFRILVTSHFDFEGEPLVLFAPVPCMLTF